MISFMMVDFECLSFVNCDQMQHMSNFQGDNSDISRLIRSADGFKN
jgi:hypothetical protein